ncbi:MAG: Do family serine endopeptidase [Candidatus Rokubacteria bacterium]|nr:Do family serine endopeptidase [Candidatus Rokubacteria bacterium]
MMQVRRRTLVGALALAVTAGFVLGAGATGRADLWRAPAPAPSSMVQAPILPVQMPLPSGSFAAVAETIKPAVINITTLSRSGGLQGRTPFEEFFGEEFFKRFFGEAPERIPQRSLGSGVVVDPTGIALTNAHVVERATDIEVITLDGGKHRAKVIGLDKKTDLAVLRLDDGKNSFRFARLGDSDKMQVGDWVIAVGSPFGLQATVTAGIISAKARQIGQGPFDDFLQTDAAINPGNSGGPLVNMRGEVIGINTAIVAGGAGIGFAIPSNMARKIYTELRDKGRVTRGWLGVSIQPLSPDLAREFGVTDARGVLVNEVVADSPAARAGLQRGDVILEFDGKKLEGPGDLQRAVGLFAPEQVAKLKIWRDQSEKVVEVKVGQAPDEREARERQGGRARSLLGLEVRPITPDIAARLNLRSTEGVFVARVEDGSSAAEAGVQRGDVIKQINRQNVRSLADFERLTRDVKEGDRLTVLLQRGPMSLYVAFTVGRG